MPFISNTESRAQMQSISQDDGSILADWDEVFDASVGFALDEGLSTSRMLNNEMYEQRREAAKVIFDNGEDRSQYTDRRGRLNFDSMAQKFDTIKTDSALEEEKSALLSRRRDNYNDIMRRSDSTSAELLGSMNAFMLDPLNIATMTIGTPFAVAKGVGIAGKAITGALGAATINLGTEALIQPLVLDYKLDIDSPYGVEDAIANMAMAAGGGLILGAGAGGISGWLGKIRGELDSVPRLADDVDPHELEIAVQQIDEMIETLESNPDRTKTYEGFEDVTVKQEGLLGRGAIKLKDGTVLIDDSAIHAQQIAKLQKLGVAVDDIESGGFIRADGSYIKGSADTPKIIEREKAKLRTQERRAEKAELKRVAEEVDGLKTLVETADDVIRQIEAGKSINEIVGNLNTANKKEFLDSLYGVVGGEAIGIKELKRGALKVKLKEFKKEMMKTISEIKPIKPISSIRSKAKEKEVLRAFNEKQIETDAAYLRALEEERARMNRTPDKPVEIKPKEIDDADLEGVYNAMDKPMVAVDGEFVDAKKIIDGFDKDIEALESMKVCLLA